MSQRWQGVMMMVAMALAAGCRTSIHQVRVDRVDQSLSEGNRGYLMGKAPEPGDRSPTRDITELEVEMGARGGRRLRTAQAPAAPAPAEEASASRAAATSEEAELVESEATAAPSPSVTPQHFKNYTVRKGDSLGRIAKRFYGHANKWRRIYDANRDKLSNPNHIRSGMTLRIPVAGGLEQASAGDAVPAPGRAEQEYLK